MAYVRYKMPEQTHKLLKGICEQLGMKESEFSRMAAIEYMRSLGVLSDRVRGRALIRGLKRGKSKFLSLRDRIRKDD